MDGSDSQCQPRHCDVIIPVPLHRWRLFSRRYNQAALLALHIRRLSHKKVWADGLLRIRPTGSQGHRNRQERRANIKNAVQVSACYRRELAEKTILLVDDILTTGSTVEECSKTLLEAGAAAIHILTLARVRAAAGNITIKRCIMKLPKLHDYLIMTL